MACFVHLVHSGVYEVTETYGESMLPTLNCHGNFVHVNKLHRLGANCKLGDVIICAKPTLPTQRVCKRITGLPGDYVLIDPSNKSSTHMIQVPQGHFWVTGDNLAQSIDSRTYGPMPLGLVKGKVVGVSDGLSFKWIK